LKKNTVPQLTSWKNFAFEIYVNNYVMERYQVLHKRLKYMFITMSWKDTKYCTSIGKISFAKTTIAQTSCLLLRKDLL